MDLLTTGVDVPKVRNIVFFRYMKSPITFYQMIGRGTRIDLPDKLMFRVYDYTGATRLFGADFVTKPASEPGELGTDGPPAPPPVPPIAVDGFEVHVSGHEKYVVMNVDGVATPVPMADFKAGLSSELVRACPTLGVFRRRWVNPAEREELIAAVVNAGYSPSVLRVIEDKDAYDLFDVLADMGYGLAPRTRQDRAFAFRYKHAAWLDGLPLRTRATVEAIADQFADDGTEGLESGYLFQVPAVRDAGGVGADRSGRAEGTGAGDEGKDVLGVTRILLSEVIREAKAGFASGKRDPDGIVQLRMNNVDRNVSINWKSFLRVPANPVSTQEYSLHSGDVLFNNTNSTALVGKSALFRGYAEPVVYSNHFTRLRTHQEKLLPEYLAAWFNHTWASGTFAEICNQWIGQSAVQAGKLLALLIPLPPLGEQARIVAELTAAMATVEKARRAAEEQLAMIGAMPAALLREVFGDAADRDAKQPRERPTSAVEAVEGPTATGWPVQHRGQQEQWLPQSGESTSRAARADS